MTVRSLLLSALLLSLIAAPASAGSMMKELTNAAKLGEGSGAADDQVSFTLHFGTEEPVVVTGRDFESFKLIEKDDTPYKLELYAGEGSEKHNILINIGAARYYRLNIAKKYGEWHYDFQFYF